MTRESIPELIYRLHLTEKTTGEKLFPDVCIWTSSRVSVGWFVYGGDCDAGGVIVNSGMLVCGWSGAGVALSLEL